MHKSKECRRKNGNREAYRKKKKASNHYKAQEGVRPLQRIARDSHAEMCAQAAPLTGYPSP